MVLPSDTQKRPSRLLHDVVLGVGTLDQDEVVIVAAVNGVDTGASDDVFALAAVQQVVSLPLSRVSLPLP